MRTQFIVRYHNHALEETWWLGSTLFMCGPQWARRFATRELAEVHIPHFMTFNADMVREDCFIQTVAADHHPFNRSFF